MSLSVSACSLSSHFFLGDKKTTLDVFNTAAKVYPRGVISTYHVRKKMKDLMWNQYPARTW